MVKLKKRTSITTIVIWMIIFFPVGIYFWHKRLTEDKTEILQNSKYSIVIGWILLIFGILSACFQVIGHLTTDGNGQWDTTMIIFVILPFVVGGFITIRRSKNMRILGEKYKRYDDIVKGKEVSIESIAEIMMLPQEEVLKDIQDMLDGGFFQGAYIDRVLMEIVLPQNKVVKNNSMLCDKVTDKI